MQRILWELEYQDAPKVIRHCQKCGTKTHYGSSGLFRVNAQKKSLDIWLIYRCDVCDHTWNAEIYTRIKPGKLSEEQLERFHRNDPALSQSYAMNTEWLQRLQAEIILPDYSVTGNIPAGAGPFEVRIVNSCMLPYKISAVLRDKLCLSQREYIKMLERGELAGQGGEDLRRGKLPKEIKIMVGVTGMARGR